MQILYSQYAANSKPKELLKILEERSLKFYLFFITYLLLFRDLKREFTEKEKIVSNKNFNNDSKLMRELVIKNQFLSFLNKSKTLEKIKIKYDLKIWDENHHLIESLFKKIFESKFSIIVNFESNFLSVLFGIIRGRGQIHYNCHRWLFRQRFWRPGPKCKKQSVKKIEDLPTKIR